MDSVSFGNNQQVHHHVGQGEINYDAFAELEEGKGVFGDVVGRGKGIHCQSQLKRSRQKHSPLTRSQPPCYLVTIGQFYAFASNVGSVVDGALDLVQVCAVLFLNPNGVLGGVDPRNGDPKVVSIQV